MSRMVVVVKSHGTGIEDDFFRSVTRFVINELTNLGWCFSKTDSKVTMAEKLVGGELSFECLGQKPKDDVDLVEVHHTFIKDQGELVFLKNIELILIRFGKKCVFCPCEALG